MTENQTTPTSIADPFRWREAVAAGYESQMLRDDPHARTKAYSLWLGKGNREKSASPWAKFRDKHASVVERHKPPKPPKGHADLPLGPLSERDAKRYAARTTKR